MKRDDFDVRAPQKFPGARGSMIPWSWLVYLAIGFAIVLSMLGCADNSRITSAQDANGRIVGVLELPDVHCPQAVSKEINGGCYWPGPVTFGYGFDRHARVHEVLDHVGGLKHGKWENGCALILASGITQWTVGKMICRTNGGDYYERAK